MDAVISKDKLLVLDCRPSSYLVLCVFMVCFLFLWAMLPEVN